MSGTSVGVDQKFWAAIQATFDTMAAFTAADAVGLDSLDINFQRQFERSVEKLGTASAEDHIPGDLANTWEGLAPIKPSGTLGTPPDIGPALYRAAFTAEFAELTVADYTNGTTDTVTVTIAGAATVLTEGSEFTAETSNEVTATNIAAAAAAVSGVKSATATGAVVRVISETGTVLLASGDTTAWSLTKHGYKLAAAAPLAAQLQKYAGDTRLEVASGAWVSQVEFDYSKPKPVVKFSGGFASPGWLYGTPALDGTTYAAAATSASLAAADADKIGPGVTVKFGAEDNGGAGYRITEVDNDPDDPTATARVLTFTPGLANEVNTAALVTPVIPASTVAGTIQGGTPGDLEVDSTSVGFIAFKATLGTGIHGLDREGNTDRAVRLARGERTLEGETEFYLLDESAGFVRGGLRGVRRSLLHRVGPDVSAYRQFWSLPRVLMNVEGVNSPEPEADFAAAFMAEKSSVPEDELEVYWT